MKISDLEGEVKIKAIAYSRRLKYHNPYYKIKMNDKRWMRYPFSHHSERTVFNSFAWGSTPEGDIYWNKVNNTGKP